MSVPPWKSPVKTTPRGFIVPAGTYWLGDPCYAVPKDLWLPLLEESDFFERPGTINGFTVYAFGTAHGDGEYEGSDGNRYPVDAELIGLTPVGLVAEEPFGSQKVTFKTDVECYASGGKLHFGHIVIDTDPDDEDDFD